MEITNKINMSKKKITNPLNVRFEPFDNYDEVIFPVPINPNLINCFHI